MSIENNIRSIIDSLNIIENEKIRLANTITNKGVYTDTEEVTFNTLNENINKITQVSSVDKVYPDENGNIELKTVKTVNDISPDENGNVAINMAMSVDGIAPDANGNVPLNAIKHSDALSLDDIENSAVLAGKIPSAQALKDATHQGDFKMILSNAYLRFSNGGSSGIKVNIWCVNNVCTAAFNGAANQLLDTGVVNAYATIPEEYSPFMNIRSLGTNDNGAMFMVGVYTDNTIGISRCFNPLTVNSAVAGILTWPVGGIAAANLSEM